MVFTCERKQMVAGQAILSETATTVQSQEYALEDIVRQHARLVYRIVYGVLRNHHEAEDATQETFVRVLRYGKKLGKVEDHKSWLARIAWRVAVDRSQRRREVQYVVASLAHSFSDDCSRLDSVEDEQTWSLLLTDPRDQSIAVQRPVLILAGCEESSADAEPRRRRRGTGASHRRRYYRLYVGENSPENPGKRARVTRRSFTAPSLILKFQFRIIVA